MALKNLHDQWDRPEGAVHDISLENILERVQVRLQEARKGTRKTLETVDILKRSKEAPEIDSKLRFEDIQGPLELDKNLSKEAEDIGLETQLDKELDLLLRGLKNNDKIDEHRSRLKEAEAKKYQLNIGVPEREEELFEVMEEVGEQDIELLNFM